MIFEKLPLVEREMISQWFIKHGNCSGEGQPPQVLPLGHILREWESSKEEYLYQMFAENFILEKEVCYTRSQDILCKDLHAALNNIDGSMREFKEIILNQFPTYTDAWYNARDLFQTNYFAENKYDFYEDHVFILNDTTITIKSGTKPMRALKKLAKVIDKEDEFEQFRLAHSMILNQKTIKGTLCLSIHPFDYVTMSDNDYNWDSCMSWENHGCYRAGTVEMMNSPCVVVAYLKGGKPFEFCNFQWSGNKKWRQLMVVHPHAICNIKEYPYQNEDLTNIALNWLVDLARNNLHWDIPYADEPFSLEEALHHPDGRTYRYNFVTAAMYNDFDTDCTNHRIFVPQGWQPADQMDVYEEITISGKSVCCWCGDLITYIEEGSEAQVLCENCEAIQRCYSCGCVVHEDYRYWGFDSECYCEDCYNDIFTEDGLTNNEIYRDQAVKVYLTRKDEYIDMSDDVYIYIHEDHVLREGLTSYSKYFNIDSVRIGENDDDCWFKRRYHYVNFSDCTKRGLELFGLYGDDDCRQAYIEEPPYYYNPTHIIPI